MTLLKMAWEKLVTKAPITERLPQATGLNISLGRLMGGIGRNQLAQLNIYGVSSVLYSVVSRISEGVAATEWQLFRKLADGEKEEIFDHPLLEMWNSIGPQTTRQEFLESSQQHFELVGESWWVIVTQGGRPIELQVVRPDRMRTVLEDGRLVGYQYVIGSSTPVPLEMDQVIMIKHPHPTDPYRGIGRVQSLMMDIGAEQMAAQFTRNFYTNGAEPGGIIQMEENMQEGDWQRFVERWQQQHQGVANAHRVAVLEGGMKWVERKMTMRNQQLNETRLFNRDVILDAFGFPRALLGISDGVNRANAEAAEVTFSRWLLKPRLNRIKLAVNVGLVEPFFGEDLELCYVDPTPEDREFALKEAVEGYVTGILTQNESRARIGEGEVEDGTGDEFKPSSGGGNFGLAPPLPHEQLGKGLSEEDRDGAMQPISLAARKLPELLFTHEQRIERNWARRLATEQRAIIAHLEQFKSVGGWLQKIELSDIDGYDWDWWAKYGEETVDELTQAFEVSIGEAFPNLSIPDLQRIAGEYARFRGARLLRIDGDLNLVNLTRARVNILVAGTIERGDSLGTLQKALREDFAFSRERASLVARTETATALGQGSKTAALIDERDEKFWRTQGDDHVDRAHCEANQAQGWIAISDVFQSGHDVIPAHPNCRCVILYRHTPQAGIDPLEGLEDDVAGAIESSRGLGLNPDGSPFVNLPVNANGDTIVEAGLRMYKPEALADMGITLRPIESSRRYIPLGRDLVYDTQRGICPDCRGSLRVNKEGPGGYCPRCKVVV